MGLHTFRRVGATATTRLVRVRVWRTFPGDCIESFSVAIKERLGQREHQFLGPGRSFAAFVVFLVFHSRILLALGVHEAICDRFFLDVSRGFEGW